MAGAIGAVTSDPLLASLLRDIDRAADRAASRAEDDLVAQERMESLILAVADALDDIDRLDPSGASSLHLVARRLVEALAAVDARPFGAVDDVVGDRYHVLHTRRGPGLARRVLEVHQRGWVRGDRVLRPACVVVSSDPTDEPEATAEEPSTSTPDKEHRG